MKKEQVLAKLRSCGLVAVVRAKDADDAMRIAEACIEGGCAGIELTYTTPGVNAIIEKMAREYDGTDFVIGAGTVMDPETARMAILSGAQYVVSPYFNGDTVRLCNRYRVACMPGAMSIAEVVAGMEAGADIIKVFPGELFGPKILKSIHGPIPQAELMPTGGVSLDNVAEWIAAGAVAVGAGGSLTLLGWLLGSSVSQYIEAVDHWVAFGLLAVIGGKMAWESLRRGCGEEGEAPPDLSAQRLCVLAIATSIDALAVGVSMAFMSVHILASAAVIGVVAFALSVTGGLVGRRLGCLFQRRAELTGGLVLIAIGVKILIEHLSGG